MRMLIASTGLLCSKARAYKCVELAVSASRYYDEASCPYRRVMNRFAVLCCLCAFSVTMFNSDVVAARSSASALARIDSVRLKFDVLSTKDGLSQGMVRCIYQDREGFLWFATKDGLNKYDGYSFVVYRNSPQDSLSLPDNYVSQILEDDQGNFWVGTVAKRLCAFDRKSERFYPVVYKDELRAPQRNEVRRLEVRGNRLLVQMLRDIYVYDISKVKAEDYRKQGRVELQAVLDFNAAFPNLNYIEGRPFKVSTTWLQDGRLLVCYADTLHICNPNKDFSTWKIEAHPMTDYGTRPDPVGATHILEVADKHLFVIQNGMQLVCYDYQASKVVFNQELDWKNDLVSRPQRDPRGNFRIACRSDYYVFDPSQFRLTKIINDQNLRLTGLTTCIDRDGVMWSGTNGYGATRYSPFKDKFKVLRKEEGIVFNATTDNAELFQLRAPDKTQGSQLLSSHIVPARYASLNAKSAEICRDLDGNSWFVFNDRNLGYAKLVCLESQKASMKAVEIDMGPPTAESKLMMSRDNTLALSFLDSTNTYRFWIIDCGTKTVRTRATLAPKKQLFEYPFVSQILNAPNGIYWFATLQGLFRFDLKTASWRHYGNDPKNPRTLGTNAIFSVCADAQKPNDYVWVGTNGAGLMHLECETGYCTAYTENDGLANNVINGVISDNASNLWMSTNHGITVMLASSLSGDAKGVSCINYSDDNGLGDYEFNRYEFAKLRDGRLVFGGINNLTVFDPASVLQSRNVSTIRFTRLSVMGQTISAIERPDIIDQPISYARTITLPYDQSSFSIEFAVLEFSSATQKQYRYWVDGVQSTWINNGSKNSVSFSNLEPGSYVLHIQGRNSFGQWSNEDVFVNIVIVPPWWRTWWFRLLALLTLVAIAVSFYRYRVSQIRKFYELRNSIARDLHDEIGSTLSSISLSTDVLLRSQKLSPDVVSMLQRMGLNAHSMMESISDIVWTINSRNDTFESLLDRITAYCVETLESLNIKLELEIDDNLRAYKLDMAKRRSLYLFIKESFNNIARHSKATRASFSLRQLSEKRVELVIYDDGIGFAVEGQLKDHKTLGGNGLYNLAERAKELGAEYSIGNRAEGQGVEIRMRFKV